MKLLELKIPPTTNYNKAKKIRGLAKSKAKRANSPRFTDTPHAYNIGGHGSTFLHR